MPSADDPLKFLPLPSAPLHILLALGNGERHGYALMRDVEALSDGAVKMGPGTLYGAIKRLLADELIEEAPQRPAPEPNEQRRRYYRLTALGERVCAAEVRRLSNLLERAGAAAWKPGRTRPGEA